MIARRLTRIRAHVFQVAFAVLVFAFPVGCKVPSNAPPTIGERFAVVDVPVPSDIKTLAFSPDGRFIVSGHEAGRVRTWGGILFIAKADNGKEHLRETLPAGVVSIAFHPDGNHVAIACSGNLDGNGADVDKFAPPPGEVQIREFPSMKKSDTLSFEGKLVGTMHFSPDGKTLAVHTSQGTRSGGPTAILVLDFPSLKERVAIKEASNFVFSADSKEILAAKSHDQRARVAVYDAATGEFKALARELTPGAHLEMSKKGVLLTVNSAVRVLDYPHGNRPDGFGNIIPEGFGKILIQRTGGLRRINWASLSPDHQQLVAIDQKSNGRDLIDVETKIIVEDFKKNELITAFEQEGVVFDRCCWAPDGKQFAASSSFYRGINSKHDDPKSGHVLLFNIKNR